MVSSAPVRGPFPSNSWSSYASTAPALPAGVLQQPGEARVREDLDVADLLGPVGGPAGAGDEFPERNIGEEGDRLEKENGNYPDRDQDGQEA